jgi:polysaccharide export outer membrane protein
MEHHKVKIAFYFIAALIGFWLAPHHVYGGEDYIIGGGDVLQLNVWGHPELSLEVPIRPDGKLSMPLVGDVRAVDLTPEELSKVIAKKLEEYISNPVVTVILTTMNSNKVYVFGNGVTSGEYILTTKMMLSEFLAKIGSRQIESLQGGNVVTQSPDYYHAYLLRKNKKIKEDFYNLFVKGDLSQDMPLMPGDVLFIPDNFQNNIKVVGSVKAPGVVTYRENITILDAILAVGGFDEFAKENDVLIVRDVEGKKKEISVRMKDLMKKGALKENHILLPGDLIIVKESLF